MSKKLLALLMVLVFAVSAFGCQPATPATPSAPAETGEEAAEPTAVPEAEAPAEEPAAEEPAAEEPAAEEPVGDTVVLDYYWIGNGDTDQRPIVEKAINEYVEPLIGVNVNFHIIGWGDWDTKAMTALRAGEKMDIIFTADWMHYMAEVSEGLLTPLNDPNGPDGNLLEQYGQGILTTITPAFIPGTQVDGVNYAVPTNKELTVPLGFVYNATIAEQIGFTPEEALKVKSLPDLEPWLEKFKAEYPNDYPYLVDQDWGFSPWLPSLAAGVPSSVVNMKQEPNPDGTFDETIYSVWETDINKEVVTIMRDWMLKGYIHPDSGLNTWNNTTVMNSGKFLFFTMPLKGENIKAAELENASGNAELKLLEIYGQSKVNVTVHAGGSMLAIPAISEYPVQAMKFLNLMHTDSKLINMMLYGAEGTHWEFEDDGRVNITNPAWYGAHGGAWTLGDIKIQAVSNKEDPEKNQRLIDYAVGSVDHPSLGFRFRTEPVAAELTALASVVDGMNRALFTGSVDPEVELPKYIEALKAAGLDTVKAEIQKQYDAWKETKK